MSDRVDALKARVDVAAGRRPADLVLRGGRIVNVLSCEVHEGDVAVASGRIVGIGRYEGARTVDLKGMTLCPGFIDGHVHIESSMLSVAEYARVVAARGTAAVVIDPHEIANVQGAAGIRYMCAAAAGAAIDVYVMASSCVPASRFESAAATLDAVALAPLLRAPGVLGLAEMMNYPGVIAADADCLEKIAQATGRPIDGHAPGLSGRDLCAYIATGIGSDHECTTPAEAREKLRLGLTLMIREGSQARNLEALLPAIRPDTLDRFMFVTDDKDVDDLLAEGHIDHMVRRAIALGMNPIHAIRIATHSAASYFGLRDLGAIAPGRRACLVVVDDLERFRVTQVYRDGALIAENGEFKSQSQAPARGSSEPLAQNRVLSEPDAQAREPDRVRSSVHLPALTPASFAIRAPATPCDAHVIEVIEDRIDTRRSLERLTARDGLLEADPARDLCKIAVIERHHASGNIGRGFVRGFGLTAGAIASTVGHDAHNLVVAGVDDADMCAAASHLAKIGGGFCAVHHGRLLADVPLPIAGLMSDADAATLSRQLQRLHDAVRQLGGKLRRPFMALSFLTLSVIGKLKITDQGLVDVARFELIDLATPA